MAALDLSNVISDDRNEMPTPSRGATARIRPGRRSAYSILVEIASLKCLTKLTMCHFSITGMLHDTTTSVVAARLT